VGRTTVRVLIVAAVACVLALAFAFHQPSRDLSAGPKASLDQGCVNQGGDRRIAATVICWAQRQLSWKSDDEPHFVLLGSPERTNIGLAWPPYVVYNAPTGQGQWRMFRVGFRYDRAWRGYIFPTIAWKLLPKPLRY